VSLPYIEESLLAFGGYRPRRDASRYSVVGVPFDSTASYRGGQRWGPASIRRVSAFIEFRSLHAGIDVDAIPIYDEGDVAVIHGDVKGTLVRISHAIRELASEGRIPIVLGGEHTITY
jgi:agmatinase